MAVATQDFDKDPNAILDYSVNWAQWLPSGDSISSLTVNASAGITLVSSSFTASTTTAWLSGGAAGVVYQVSFLITTTGGRTDERTLTIHCGQR